MFTTSRYASIETRKLAKKQSAVDGERYKSRGKKTVQELVLLARRLGEERICIIGEKGKKPASISSLEVLAHGGWKWKEKRAL